MLMKPLATCIAVAAALGLAAASLTAAPTPGQALPDPLTLENAIGYALQNNYAIRQARELIRQQQGVEIQVEASRIPSLSASAGYTGSGGKTSPYLATLEHNWSITLQARQVLYAGGGVDSSVRSARLTREAAVLQLQGVINQQLLAVRTQFYAVLLDRSRIGVQEDNVKLLQQQLKDARSRFSAGTTSSFDVLQAEVALANGQPPLIQARNDFRVAIEQLRQLLGDSSQSATSAKTPDVAGSLDIGKQLTVDLDDALAAARANRPELQRLVKLEKAGEQSVTTARSAQLPQVDLVGNYDWNRGYPTAGWNDHVEGWSAGIQAQWDIFDGRATAGRVMQARSQVAQAKLQLADTTLNVDVQVRQAYSSLTEAWELVQASAKTVEQAEEALRLAKVRYGAGTATQLDVLTSQVALTQARLNQLQAYYGYHVAVAGMREAMGLADVFLNK